MSDAGWYQRKLAQMRGRPQQTPVSPSRGTVPYQPVPQQPGPVPGVPTQQFMQFQPAAPPPETVTIENIYEQAGRWRGGPGARANPDACPQCGGNQYFENVPHGKRGPAPAGHCYNCGYNGGLFTQGMASSWQG